MSWVTTPLVWHGVAHMIGWLLCEPWMPGDIPAPGAPLKDVGVTSSEIWPRNHWGLGALDVTSSGAVR